MSSVSSEEVPDDGGIGDMLNRRMRQEGIASSWGCDPADVQVDYPVPRSSTRPGKRLYNNDGGRLDTTPPTSA